MNDIPNTLFTEATDSHTANRADGHGGNVPEFSVSDISNALKRTVEETYNFVKIRGEVSGFKCPSSGHWYFSLKDEDAVLSAVCWRGVTSRIGIVPQDGMEVVVTGKITTYGARSSYQIVIDSLEPAGEGALLKILEDRKKQLASEGLFDESRKQNIPPLPTVIGVITSPTGAVIRDILHRINDRFPRHILLWGVAVQGQGSAEQVANAIAGFNTLPPNAQSESPKRPDVIIVARGGGSLEDLWAFNEECVARAVAESDIPIISAVGHETDTTLIDFVSDRRAPTPTAAAEMAVPVRVDLQNHIYDLSRRLHQSTTQTINQYATYIDTLARALPDTQTLLGHAEQRIDDIWGSATTHAKSALQHHRHQIESLSHQLKSPADIIAHKYDMVNGFGERLALANSQTLSRNSDRLSHIESLLESYSYRNVLQRGFSVIRTADGAVVQTVGDAKKHPALNVEFYDGTVTLSPTETALKKKPSKPQNPSPQGTLL